MKSTRTTTKHITIKNQRRRPKREVIVALLHINLEFCRFSRRMRSRTARDEYSSAQRLLSRSDAWEIRKGRIKKSSVIGQCEGAKGRTCIIKESEETTRRTIRDDDMRLLFIRDTREMDCALFAEYTIASGDDFMRGRRREAGKEFSQYTSARKKRTKKRWRPGTKNGRVEERREKREGGRRQKRAKTKKRKTHSTHPDPG